MPANRHPAQRARIVTGVVSVVGVAGLTAFLAGNHAPARTTATATVTAPAPGTVTPSTTSTTVAASASAAAAATPAAAANTSSHGS
jgi:hypothetical protein